MSERPEVMIGIFVRQLNAKLADEYQNQKVEIARLRAPWSPVDSRDWEYLFSLIPDGGRGRFWKNVFNEMRVALDDS